MTTGRLEALSDGVIAIILTIMVLEMKVPHGDGLENLWPLLPLFLSYVLALIVPVYHRVDGREPVHRGSDCALRRDIVDGVDRLPHAPAGDHPNAGARFHLKKSGRARLERQAIAGAEYRCDHCGSALPVGRPRRFL